MEFVVVVVVGVVVVVVIVIVVLVGFERWSGPVNGFRCTGNISGAQLCCFCVYFISFDNIV